VAIAGQPGEWINGGNEAAFLVLPLVAVGGRGGSLPRRMVTALRAAWTLRRWLRENPVDLMHAHDSTPAFVARLARIGLGVPLIVTYHGSEPERLPDFGRTARGCDLTVTPSHRSAEDLATLGGIPRDRLRVIGLGVTPPPPVSDAEAAALRARLTGDGDRLILTMARLTAQKGIDILIDCVARLTRDHPGWRFVVAGDGPEEERLKALAKARGVDRVLSFIGRTDAPHLHLRAADLFLLTSRWEALPFTIVEAFQAGCPAVATACSGVVELIDDSVGRVAPVGDVAAICAAVEEVLMDEATRRALALAALERAREPRFDPDYVHRQFEALYRAFRR
jgi:glycosyltransferase involved in cell wall biosynthesis